MTAPGAACEVTDGCITCGDVAVPLTVLGVSGVDARCRDADGREELVATELVGAVGPGDRLLVHARVAIARLGEAARGDGGVGIAGAPQGAEERSEPGAEQRRHR